MLSRVAAVKAPNKHNRRRVIGSSGRRREGGESEPQRPNMSRRVFTSAVLLLFVVLMCCGGAATAEVGSNADASIPSGSTLTGVIAGEGSTSGGVEGLQRVDLFVPQTTQVLPKKGTPDSSGRDSFVSPSLVSAGGVIAAFAEGHINAKPPHNESTKPSSDVVAEYIDSAWEWPTLVEKVGKGTWSAHTVLGKAEGEGSLGVVRHPTTTMKDNKVFLLVGSTALSDVNGGWKEGSLELKLVVGEVTKTSAGGEPSEWIKWGEVQSPVQQTTLAAHKGNLTECIASGGSCVLMEDGTIVFSLMAKSGNDVVYSMIIYSTDSGSTWALPEGASPAECSNPRITEWEGSLLMIVDCEDAQRVYESRDMGTTWTGAAGTLPGVWVNSQSEDYPDGDLHVDALITATIGKRKVMLYTQRGNFSGKQRENANPLYLWVTDNNRSFSVGPFGMDNAEKEKLESALLYSDGSLHLLQRRGNGEGSVMSLSRLTEELSTINSVLSTWSQKDIFFSRLSIPTAGLVAVLSDAASDGTWNDEYLRLNATVTPNAKKVEDGLQVTEPDSRVMWSVNSREKNGPYTFENRQFVLVATVAIHQVPSEDAPLLGATLGDTNFNHTMGILYTADNKWVTMFDGKNTTTEGSTWEPKKEYKVALMLQGNKGFVYIDGESLGEEETPLTGERQLELAYFCFGACGMQNSPVTVKNVFLYDRPLSVGELKLVRKSDAKKGKGDGSMRGAVSRVLLLLLLLLLGLCGFSALYGA
ncbi:putative trans-sialidase, Group II [Trypanosoma cruzi]|uniref:Trans-sialidase, putative n=2 Tax=Trypanosoma cruzi TaxID=5693 RepID=Q4DYC8_TRYCC|nr:trans-sialidase, putative [Trypanosoma cruzi]EAN97532.1 trans-sialidase, putative [Trypanosoma cruzi]PWV11513.1 putative trans-sialidase, Group II [Trypanosoma cruzi]|eukprot:XP_819383.1 trans-sialidase [Trypanosoma cruzi strain CL Brener]